MNKFKVGDLVYFPIQTHKVLKLIENHYEGSKECYPFMLEGDEHTTLTELGTFEYRDFLPPILHATQESYELLSKLYPNVTFEPPPKRKEPREVVKAKLENGWHYIYDEDNPPPRYQNVLIYIEDDIVVYNLQLSDNIAIAKLVVDDDGHKYWYTTEKCGGDYNISFPIEIKFDDVDCWRLLPQPPQDLYVDDEV